MGGGRGSLRGSGAGAGPTAPGRSCWNGGSTGPRAGGPPSGPGAGPIRPSSGLGTRTLSRWSCQSERAQHSHARLPLLTDDQAAGSVQDVLSGEAQRAEAPVADDAGPRGAEGRVQGGKSCACHSEWFRSTFMKRMFLSCRQTLVAEKERKGLFSITQHGLFEVSKMQRSEG